MKYFYLLTLSILISSCGIFKNTYQHKYVVTVLDEHKNIPVKDAAVYLISIIEAKDVYEELFYTDSLGQCEINVDSPIPENTHLVIRKGGYERFLSLEEGDENLPHIIINEHTPEDLVFYLTSDPLNHYNYFKAKKPRYEMDSFIEMLRTNRFPQQQTLPQLKWEDIPSLLNAGNDTSIINRYPVNPISSLTSTDRYMGIVTLWFIECIRLTEQQEEYATRTFYPSQTPFLLYYGSDSDKYPANSKELMELTYTEYYSWWQTVKLMDRKEACKINPLENIKVNWR